MRKQRYIVLTRITLITICSVFIFSTQGLSAQEIRDKPIQEALGDVMQTRQQLLYNVAGKKFPKVKDPREGLYALVNVGVAYTPNLGTSSILGVEAGYDFILGRIHSLRVFGFFDRTNYGAFADFEFDSTKPNRMQIYRGGISVEYRIYASSFLGFRIRLASLGASSFSRTSDSLNPTFESQRKKWFYPTIAIGPIFYYKRHHELFVGFDLIDYQSKRDMTINYLKYSLRF
uniref:Outer membrane protein beta-barrel domain-containing protein n=1 Tax=uncultured Helicobacter sp. TaxID=175537 RepID=A0A650ELA9_9HELI|nr:hypothetical protein Helico5904_1910 [uncultured Helicobacter sp.]